MTREQSQDHFDLGALLDTTRLLIESYDLDFVLNHLLLIMMGKLLITRGAALLYEQGNTYRVVKTKGRIQLREHSLVTLPDAARLREKLFHEFNPEDSADPCQNLPTETHILITLKTGNQHLGFVCLGPKGTGHSLTDREKDFLQTLSVMASIAIYNTRLFNKLTRSNRDLDRKVQELHTLFDISKEFGSSTDRNKIQRIFTFALLGQLYPRRFFLLLENGTEHELAAGHRLVPPPDPEDMEWVFRHTGDLLRDQQVTELAPPPFITKNEICLLMPLLLQEGIRACIGLAERAGGETYESSDLNFISSLGNLTLLAIQKTWLLEERIAMERLEKELSIARDIQRGLFPEHLPASQQFELAARNLPSRQVGGDYYDTIVREDGSLLVAIGDVTGKGVPASLIMANIQALLQALPPSPETLAEQTAHINRILYQNTPVETFVTFFWGILHPDGETFTYVNAGHNPPFLIAPDATTSQTLGEGGLILGVLPGAVYRTETITFKPGSLLLLYTDGITEAMNASSTEFGETRLLELATNACRKPLADITGDILRHVMDFADNQPGDDLTLLLLRTR